MKLTEWLGRCPLVAILRGVRPDEALAIGEVLADGGFAIVEVPLNSPEPLQSIRLLADRFAGRMLVGAGTVMTPEQVADIYQAGGRLIVTPHAAVDVVRAAKALGMLACPGFATPTEAFSLLAAGADGLKLFPAEAFTPAVLKAMRAVLPKHTPILPVGGVGPGTMAPWIAAGANGFGLGSSLYKPGDTAADVAAKVRLLAPEWQGIRA
jgi:2-dehydro-3-deoxyphosphogalactonate aldolase